MCPPPPLDLADRYWPGPLTLVLNRARTVSDLITAGQDTTMAVRVPDHPVTSALWPNYAAVQVTPSRWWPLAPTSPAR